MNEDFFDILRKIHKNPIATQRYLANELNFSLGKININTPIKYTRDIIS